MVSSGQDAGHDALASCDTRRTEFVLGCHSYLRLSSVEIHRLPVGTTTMGIIALAPTGRGVHLLMAQYEQLREITVNKVKVDMAVHVEAWGVTG